ncbi:MAG: DNRLRE domain-containing protein [Tepidisphaeraceae bacterium]
MLKNLRSLSPRLESLESRTLFALAAGFEQVKVAQVETYVATSMEFAPDGRVFLVDNTNREIRVIKNGVLQSTPAIKFTDQEVDRFRERGLETMAFDPDFETNRYVYLYYTTPDPAAPNTAPSNAVNRLVRYTMSTSNPDVINKSSALVLLDNVPSPSSTHNGGAMHFGADGMLYLAIGDGGQTATLAQDLSSPNGKVLRLDVSAVGATANATAMAPTDNPFYNAADGISVRDYVYAYGFRNPFSGDIKPGTNTLFINDVGAELWEEINDIQAGKNYGWPVAEGNSSNPAHTDPVHAYTHFPNGLDEDRESSSITGGVFYSGNQFPTQYAGKYFFGDYLRQFIKVLDPATGQVTNFYTNPSASDILDIVDFEVAPDGTLWTLSLAGTVRKYRYVGSGNRAPDANATASATSGTTPLVVNFSGAASTDPDGNTLTYAWDFGDGTTGTGRDVQKTYATPGTFIATLTVSDGKGGSDQADPMTIVAGSAAPTGTITTPLEGSVYRGGRTISFSGEGADPEDGALPASAFEWKIVFHHDTHNHPFIDSIPGVTSGSFVIPRIGEQAPDQWYRIHLTVTDSDGAKHTTFRDVFPRLTTISFAANEPGVQITLDGTPVEAPASIQSVEGMIRTIGVEPTQTAGGKTYAFAGWSDGGAESHEIAVPVSSTTFFAEFTQTAGPVDTIVPARMDTLVRDGNWADVNYGADRALVVKTLSKEGNRRYTYVKFDLSGIAFDPGQGVTLRLWGQLLDEASGDATLSVHPIADTAWGERSMTWNTRPLVEADAIDSETVSGTALKRYEWDVTSYVAAERAAGRNGLAFALVQEGSAAGLSWFVASEGVTYGPALVLNPPAATVTTDTAAYVRWGASAGQNFGNDASLQVKLSTDENLVRETFLRFDLSSLALSLSNGTITSATLRLFGKLNTVAATGVTIGAYSAPGTSWTESSLTFNNRPPTTPGLPLSTATIKGTTGGWYEWDVTSFLQAEKAAGRNLVTIALKATTVSDPLATFNADGATNAPHLLIT